MEEKLRVYTPLSLQMLLLSLQSLLMLNRYLLVSFVLDSITIQESWLGKLSVLIF